MEEPVRGPSGGVKGLGGAVAGRALCTDARWADREDRSARGKEGDGKEPASPVGKERERVSVVKGTEGNVICDTPCPWAFGKTMLGSVHRREDTILILLQSAL